MKLYISFILYNNWLQIVEKMQNFWKMLYKLSTVNTRNVYTGMQGQPSLSAIPTPTHWRGVINGDETK